MIVASRRQSDSGRSALGRQAPGGWRWARGLLQPALFAPSFKLTVGQCSPGSCSRHASAMACQMASESTADGSSRVVGSESSPTPTSPGSARCSGHSHKSHTTCATVGGILDLAAGRQQVRLGMCTPGVSSAPLRHAGSWVEVMIRSRCASDSPTRVAEAGPGRVGLRYLRNPSPPGPSLIAAGRVSLIAPELVIKSFRYGG